MGRLTLADSNNIVNAGDLPEGIWALARHHTDYGGKYAYELRHLNFRRFASES